MFHFWVKSSLLLKSVVLADWWRLILSWTALARRTRSNLGTQELPTEETGTFRCCQIGLSKIEPVPSRNCIFLNTHFSISSKISIQYTSFSQTTCPRVPGKIQMRSFTFNANACDILKQYNCTQLMYCRIFYTRAPYWYNIKTGNVTWHICLSKKQL